MLRLSALLLVLVGATADVGQPDNTFNAQPTTVSGNAGTATALQTVRTVDGLSFDGTANVGTVVTVTSGQSPYTLATGVRTVLCDTTSGSITVTAPAASTLTNRYFDLVKIAAANTCTFDPNSSETVNGSSTDAMTTQYTSHTYVTNASNWFIK